MLTRAQFLIMLALSIAGTVFCKWLVTLDAWGDVFEWLMEAKLYDFMLCIAVVVAFCAVAVINMWVTDKMYWGDQRKADEEEMKYRVAQKVSKARSKELV